MMFNINDLQAIKAQPEQLEKFHNTWIMVLDAMERHPDEETLNHLYYKRVKGIKILAEDINHYNRQTLDLSDRS